MDSLRSDGRAMLETSFTSIGMCIIDTAYSILLWACILGSSVGKLLGSFMLSSLLSRSPLLDSTINNMFWWVSSVPVCPVYIATVLSLICWEVIYPVNIACVPCGVPWHDAPQCDCKYLATFHRTDHLDISLSPPWGYTQYTGAWCLYAWSNIAEVNITATSSCNNRGIQRLLNK